MSTDDILAEFDAAKIWLEERAQDIARALTSLLFGVSRLEPITYLGVIALLGAVSILACSVPAWRAARVDPAITLRAE